MLTVHNLSKAYPSTSNFFFNTKPPTPVLNNISFQLKFNETLGIIGESGSGKSTLAKLIMLLEDPSSGYFEYNDSDFSFSSKKKNQNQVLKKYKHKITMVFQETFNSLNPKKNILQILSEPLIIQKKNISKNKLLTRSIEIIESVGLNKEILTRLPNEFSGGQRQRIGIARALMIQPKIIILDEPVSALDVSIQSQILNLLVKLKQQYNLSYIFIGHDLSIVKYMADKIIVLYKGDLIEQQETQKLFSNPKSDITKKMITDAKNLEMGMALL